MPRLMLVALVSITLARPALSQCVAVGQALTVRTNTTCRLTSPLPVLLASLVMEDNSRLEIAAVPSWTVHIRRADLGNNTVIDLGGGDGVAGADIPGTGEGQGRKAANGGRGGRGSNGHDLDMTIGLRSLVKLSIDSSGGRGGKGGQGQKAGRGPNADCDQPFSPSGDAGEPGDGGIGGDGGDTGRVTIRWFDAGLEQAAPPSPPPGSDEAISPVGLLVVGSPGPGGSGGFGGDGNEAGSRACGCVALAGGCTGLGTGSPSKTHIQARSGVSGNITVPVIIRERP